MFRRFNPDFCDGLSFERATLERRLICGKGALSLGSTSSCDGSRPSIIGLTVMDVRDIRCYSHFWATQFKISRDSYLSFISSSEMSFVLVKCSVLCRTRVQHPDEVFDSIDDTSWLIFVFYLLSFETSFRRKHLVINFLPLLFISYVITQIALPFIRYLTFLLY